MYRRVETRPRNHRGREATRAQVPRFLQKAHRRRRHGSWSHNNWTVVRNSVEPGPPRQIFAQRTVADLSPPICIRCPLPRFPSPSNEPSPLDSLSHRMGGRESRVAAGPTDNGLGRPAPLAKLVRRGGVHDYHRVLTPAARRHRDAPSVSAHRRDRRRRDDVVLVRGRRRRRDHGGLQAASAPAPAGDRVVPHRLSDGIAHEDALGGGEAA